MKLQLAKVLFSLLLVISTAFTAAQEKRTQPEAAKLAVDAERTEVAVLRAQLELMRQYDQRLLATVYWALGGIVTLVIVLVGFGWFTNFKLYERDKKTLRDELLSELRQRLAEIKLDTDRRLTSDMSRLEKSLTEGATKSTEGIRDQLRSGIESIRRELAEHTYMLLKHEANFWESDGVFINALRKQPEMMRVATSIASDAHVSETLDNMHRLIKKGASARLHPTDLSELSALLDSLPTRFSVDIEAIRGLLRAARTGENSG